MTVLTGRHFYMVYNFTVASEQTGKDRSTVIDLKLYVDKET